MSTAAHAADRTVTANSARHRATAVTIALCFCAALLEGLDIVAAGIAAPKLVPDFGLSPAQAGRLFSSSTVGLLFGAIYGGWLADRVGRKRVLVVSMVLFGLLSLATAFAPSYVLLLTGRFLTGLGLGAAMPNLIALAAEAGSPRMRTTLVTLMYSGVPLGGAVAGAIGWLGGPDMDWRVIFYVGGIGPLVVAPLLAIALPESRLFQRTVAERAGRAAGSPATPRASAVGALFGDGRAVTTLLVWVSFCCTLLILYLLVNWLPLLLVGKGYSRPDANLVTIIFNIGGGTGAIVLGLLMDRASRRLTMIAIYVGMAVALLALARVSGGFAAAAASGFACGVFVIGAQLVLYGVVPNFYTTPVRATGVGAAVAAGRLGSIAGPLVAGELLSAGRAAASVITSLLPVVAVAGVTALLLLRRPAEID